jgi:hypothetical protein
MVSSASWKRAARDSGIDEAAMRTKPPRQKRVLWLRRAMRTSLGREIRIVSSIEGAKVTYKDICPMGKTIPHN